MTKSDIHDPILVTQPVQLELLVASLLQEAIIAVDTESNSLHAYQEQVCLIQFSIPSHDYLVDPLALDDLSPLAQVFSNPQIEKVFHAAEYDLICLKRDFNFSFSNLFDTMLGAKILSWERLGLGAILEQRFNVRMNKKFQRANWGRRPLPAEQLSYARLDTHYLIPLREMMYQELVETGRMPIAKEDFKRACRIHIPEGESLEKQCWKVNGAYDLDRRQSAVLKELCIFRDRVAKKLDRPLFKVLGDRTLLEIATRLPRTSKQLYQLNGLTRWQAKKFGKDILSAVELGLTKPPLRISKSKPPGEDFLKRLEALRNWRKVEARKIGVDSGVILPRDVMIKIVHRNPDNVQALRDLMTDVPWRHDRYGGDILGVLNQLERSRS